MLKNIFNFFVRSSVDPDKLSATIQGFFVASASTIVFLGVSYLKLDPKYLNIENVILAGTLIGGAVGAVVSLTGFIRKIFVLVSNVVTHGQASATLLPINSVNPSQSATPITDVQPQG